MKVSAEYITIMPMSKKRSTKTSVMLDVTPYTTLSELIAMAAEIKGEDVRCTDRITIKTVIENHEDSGVKI